MNRQKWSGVALTLALATVPALAGDTGSMAGMMAQQRPGMMGCPMMSGGMGGGMAGGMAAGRGLPTLPPGNEKLQLQMQAEILQKVGEIMTKYAGQIQSR